MLIVTLCGQLIDCRPNVVVRRCMEVRGTYIGFSCWLVDCKLWVLVVVWGIKFVVSVVSDSRPNGFDLHR